MKVTVQQAVQGYLEELQSLGLAATTLRDRRSFLTRFANACDEVAKEASPRWPDARMDKLEPPMVARYFLNVCGEQGNRNNALTHVRGFFKWAVRMRYIDPSEGERLLGNRKIAKATRKPKHYIKVEQFEEMLEVGERRHPECRAILAIALYTLCRQSEISAMQLKDIDLREMDLQAYRQKRKRWTGIGICPELADEMNLWLAWYAEEMGYASPRQMMTEHPDWYLVPARRYRAGAGSHGRFAASHVNYTLLPDHQATRLETIVKPVLDALGVEGTEHGSSRRHLGEGMHTIRRSGARAMLDYLEDEVGEERALRRVSTMLDHQSLEQTLLYVGRDIEREKLNTWLKGHSMYGQRRRPQAGSNVVRLAR